MGRHRRGPAHGRARFTAGRARHKRHRPCRDHRRGKQARQQYSRGKFCPLPQQTGRRVRPRRNYTGITHPSLPNYLALTSGTTAGITGDCAPKDSGCTANVRSIADAVAQSGRSWKSYAEGMPAPCQAKNSGRYAVRHNPFMYYPGVTGDQGSCAAHVVPFTQLGQDLKSASAFPISCSSPRTCATTCTTAP